MMDPSRIFHFINHFFSAKTKYAVHSPFVYRFCTEVLPHSLSKEGYNIHLLRKQLCQSNDQIHHLDLGAGSSFAKKNYSTTQNTHKAPASRSIKQLAQNSSRRRREGEFLMRLCKLYQVQRALELGTHLGISALYQLHGLPSNSKFLSIEGAPELAALARKHFLQFGFDQQIIVGDFDEVLNHQVQLSSYLPDYVFIDGNHNYEPTIRYVKTIVPFMQPPAILVLDDIYWSQDMLKAWQDIIQMPEITVSIDLFAMGICFIRRPQAKEHFRFRLL